MNVRPCGAARAWCWTTTSRCWFASPGRPRWPKPAPLGPSPPLTKRSGPLERPRQAVRDDRDVAVAGPSEPEPAVPAGADRAGPPQAVRPLHLPCLRLVAGRTSVSSTAARSTDIAASLSPAPATGPENHHPPTRPGGSFIRRTGLPPPTAGPVPSGAEHPALEAPGCSGCRSASQSTRSRPAGARSRSPSANSRAVPEAELHHVKATARTAAVEPRGP